MTAASTRRSAQRAPGKDRLAALLSEVRACTICRDRPARKPLPHAPRPVLRVTATARILVASQAPGARVHASGLPFDDASGDRLRDWMGIGRDEFYDEARIAFLPMGFCFPGNDAKGGDLPPRRECAPAWRARLLRELASVELILLVGRAAIEWHRPEAAKTSLEDVIAEGRQGPRVTGAVREIALPHPSWRNTHWLKARPWFEAEIVPLVRREVDRALCGSHSRYHRCAKVC